MDIQDYSFVTERGDKIYMRNNIDPTDEICVEGEDVKSVIIKEEI